MSSEQLIFQNSFQEDIDVSLIVGIPGHISSRQETITSA